MFDMNNNAESHIDQEKIDENRQEYTVDKVIRHVKHNDETKLVVLW